MADEVETYFKDPAKRPPRRRQWNSTLPASTTGLRRSGKRKPRPPGQNGVTSIMRNEVYNRDGGMCRAAGVHHPDCPGRLPAGDWVPHHVWPRQFDGVDDIRNLIAVWCPGGFGLNGCHGRIHNLPFVGKGSRPDLLWRPSAEQPVPAWMT